jgi:hypothetical protein
VKENGKENRVMSVPAGQMNIKNILVIKKLMMVFFG